MSASPAGTRFADFPSDFEGSLFRPGDPGYSDARYIFNMRWVDHKPALIAQAKNVDDVVRVMRYANANDIPVAVRAGGHGVDGSAMPHDQLVLDLSQFRSLTVDPETRIARAGAGILLGDIDKGCQEYGLVVPSGTVSTTGVSGLTLGGGVGYNHRKYGATVDNLISCEVVTTDGRVITASETENPDLFWALRGGGGNFGVVTSYEFQAHKIGPMVGAGVVLYALENAAPMLRKLDDYMKTAPRELSVIAAIVPTPPMPGIPEKFYGVYMVSLLTVYTGDLANLDGIVETLASLGNPSAVAVGPAPWVVVNSVLDQAAPYGRRVHTRGGYLTTLTDDTIKAVLDSAARAPAPTVPGPSTVQNIWFLSGAIVEDYDEDYVAFSREGAEIFWECVGQWDDPKFDESYVAWVDSAADALDMRRNGYVNLTTDRGPEWLSGLYGKPEKFQRLLDIKQKWDPKNLLRFNKNFKPATD